MSDRDAFREARDAAKAKLHEKRLRRIDRGDYSDQTTNPLWPHPEQRDDPKERARQIARVLLGLLSADVAEEMASIAAMRGEGWLLDCWEHIKENQ